jgi:hypothetical protein
MRIGKSSILLAFAWGLFGSVAARADLHDVALATDGTVYQVRADLYGKLFPQGKETAASNPVVALDVTTPDGPPRRILVPSTGGADVESLPSVLFADDSQTVFLLWRTEFNFHPLLQLAGFDGRSWSKVIQVTGGNPFADKTSPQFTISRDAYEDTAADGTGTTHHRVVLHLIWQEQNAANQLATFYTPIVINDGTYIGWNPIYDLDDFLPVSRAVAGPPAGNLTSLISTPMLQVGPDSRTVVVVYTSASTTRMAAVEVDVLPQELGQLAEKARAHIVDLGRKSYPANYVSMAEDCRAHIVDLGVAFQPQVISSIADRVRALILEEGAQGSDLLALAEKARAHIVDLGAQLSGWGLRPSGNQMAKILEIGDTPNPVPPADGVTVLPSYLFQFRVSANLPAPQVGTGTVRLFSSETGENLIVSWAQPDRIFYRNSRADGTWSDPKQLVFSNNLDLTKAYQILDQRLRSH